MNAIQMLNDTAGVPAVVVQPTEIFFKISGHLEIKDTGKALDYVEGAVINIDLSQTETAGSDGIRKYVRLFMYNKVGDNEQFYVVHLPLSGPNAYVARSALSKLRLIKSFEITPVRLVVARGDASKSESGRAGVFLNVHPVDARFKPRRVLPDIRARYIERNQIALAVNTIASRIGNQATLSGECPTQARSLTPSQATS